MRVPLLLVPCLALLLVGCPPRDPARCDDGSPVGLDGTCPPDAVPCDDGVRVEDRCVVAGVPGDGCGTGFDSDGAGGCLPRRPTAACTGDTMALPGDEDCRPVMACGKAPFGGLPDADLYVLARADPSLADGTKDAPFSTIGAALAVATAGATIDIGPGRYPEQLRPTVAVSLVGLCPGQVVVDAGTAGMGLLVEKVDGVTARGLTLTGEAGGVGVADASGTRLSFVHLTGGSAAGWIWAETEATDFVLEDSLVSLSGNGVVSLGADVEVLRTEVRRLVPRGPAISAAAVMNVSDAFPGSVFVQEATFETIEGFGVAASGGSVQVEDALVRGMRVDTYDEGGYGVAVVRTDAALLGATLLLTDSVVTDQGRAGVYAEGFGVQLTGTVIAHVFDEKGDGLGGYGLGILDAPDTGGVDSGVRVVGVAVRDTDVGGIFIESSTTTLDRVRVDAPASTATEVEGGHGVALSLEPGEAFAATVTDLVVLGAREVGLGIFGVDTTIDGLVVGDTAASNLGLGDGLLVSAIANDSGALATRPVVAAAHVHAEGNARAGVSVFGGDLTLSASSLKCNALDLNAQEVFAFSNLGAPISRAASVTDGGGNLCGCEADAECTIASETLAATAPPDNPPGPGF